MKSINEVKEQVKSDMKDPIESTMIRLCNRVHPLSDFIVECFKPEYKDEVTPLTDENIIEKMQDYIDFAFEKARGGRGISASRSMWKFQKWLWVLEDTEIDCEDYSGYGISKLEQIVKKYNLVVNHVY